jgi:hypothetical protein
VVDSDALCEGPGKEQWDPKGMMILKTTAPLRQLATVVHII